VTATQAKNLGLVFCLCVCGASGGESSRVCDLAVKHDGLAEYAAHADADKNGIRTIKADIDLDGALDELRWLDRSSGSLVPTDNSSLTLTLTSNKQGFKLEQQRLQVVNYESRYYVIATRVETALGPWYRDVFAVTGKGITKVCSFDGKAQAP